MRNPRVPKMVRGLLFVGTLGALLWYEWRRPLRKPTRSKADRAVRNMALAFLGSAVIRLAEEPVVNRMLEVVDRRGWGLVRKWPLPSPLRTALAVLLFDYTMYLWHVLNHRVSVLWRCHLVHHTDRDLDVFTALRFHFTELVLSVPLRVGQVTLIGPTRWSYSLWQILFFLSVFFHHSNVRLAIATERRLNYLLVTPRMHGIHHSVVRDETDSNWSSGLTLWDWLHGTLRINVPQDEITIGVPGYPDIEEFGIRGLIVLPFEQARADWQLPDGTHPVRPSLPDPLSRLAE